MAIFVPWLVDAARLTGYPVVEVDGWRGRGHGGMTSVEGVVLHHTAGPVAGDMPSLRVVRDGRPDLTGPLANYGLGRSGTVFVVAAGCAFHAGKSAWAGMEGLNSRFLGIEAESHGTGDWTDAQRDAYPRLVAAALHFMSRGADRAAAHREVALPVGRKVDATGIEMPSMRARVTELLHDPLKLIPRNGNGQDPPPPPVHPPTIRRGADGPAVELLQRHLGIAQPGTPGFGHFGPVTEKIVRRFQAEHHLDVDGKVGPDTWTALGL